MKQRIRALVGFAFCCVFAPGLLADVDVWERMMLERWRKR